jgi:hypothetical protein
MAIEHPQEALKDHGADVREAQIADSQIAIEEFQRFSSS